MKTQKPIRKITLKFRPQEKRTAKARRTWQDDPYRNFKPRGTGYHEWANRPLNEIVLGRIGGVIHSYCGHGIDRVLPRWKNANIRFNARFPKRASVKYHNTWSAGRFL